jgi:ATP-dependent helicase/nuclease subunit A
MSAGRGAEVPIEACLPNGEVVKGQVDLLLDVPAGWILIDHKANPRGGDAWEEVARRYSGQLKLYKDAICAATSRPVAEVWLYFPVAAGAISLRV